MIIGDSIAVGIAMYRKDCITYSKSGQNSRQWNKDYLNKASTGPVKTLIISLGANDLKNINTEEELRRVRSEIKAARVFWISPGAERKPIAQKAIERIAQDYGDTILLRPAQYMSSDGVHPTGTGYKLLGEQTK